MFDSRHKLDLAQKYAVLISELNNESVTLLTLPQVLTFQFLTFHFREQLKERYGGNADIRFKSDYTRTKQDWYRMELEELKKINEVNRGHMQLTCHTYLGTSRGSRKAVASLAKVLD